MNREATLGVTADYHVTHEAGVRIGAPVVAATRGVGRDSSRTFWSVYDPCLEVTRGVSYASVAVGVSRSPVMVWIHRFDFCVFYLMECLCGLNPQEPI